MRGRALNPVGVMFHPGRLPGSHRYFLIAASIWSLWRSSSFRACLKMTEMTSVGILVGGTGKATLAGGRERAVVPKGHQHRAARTPLGMLPMLLALKGRTQGP